MSHDPDDDLGEGAERRSFFRVLTRLPVHCRALVPDERESLTVQILDRRTPDLSHVDLALADWLARIERKLDRLLMQLGIGEPAVFTADDVQEVMLSGSGLGFAAPEPLERGASALVEFELPGPPVQRVRCIAQVVRILRGKRVEDPATTAVSFEVIHDGDREAIVRHAVEVQRSLIRSRVPRPGVE